MKTLKKRYGVYKGHLVMNCNPTTVELTARVTAHAIINAAYYVAEKMPPEECSLYSAQILERAAKEIRSKLKEKDHADMPEMPKQTGEDAGSVPLMLPKNAAGDQTKRNDMGEGDSIEQGDGSKEERTAEIPVQEMHKRLRATFEKETGHSWEYANMPYIQYIRWLEDQVSGWRGMAHFLSSKVKQGKPQ